MEHNKFLSKIASVSIIMIISLTLFSCSNSRKIAYTSDIQKAHKFSEENLKKVQFYTSEEIVLVQTKQDGDVIISNGKLVVRNNKDIEKIIIPKNTKCVLESIVDDNKFTFSFEVGQGRVLLFGNDGEGRFSLMAKGGFENGAGIIPYADKNYVTTNGGAFLMISAKKLNKLKAKERVIRGRTI